MERFDANLIADAALRRNRFPKIHAEAVGRFGIVADRERGVMLLAANDKQRLPGRSAKFCAGQNQQHSDEGKSWQHYCCCGRYDVTSLLQSGLDDNHPSVASQTRHGMKQAYLGVKLKAAELMQ